MSLELSKSGRSVMDKSIQCRHSPPVSFPSPTQLGLSGIILSTSLLCWAWYIEMQEIISTLGGAYCLAQGVGRYFKMHWGLQDIFSKWRRNN